MFISEAFKVTIGIYCLHFSETSRHGELKCLCTIVEHSSPATDRERCRESLITFNKSAISLDIPSINFIVVASRWVDRGLCSGNDDCALLAAAFKKAGELTEAGTWSAKKRTNVRGMAY